MKRLTSKGRCFYDGNKRTVFRSMQICLLFDIYHDFNTKDIGQKIAALDQDGIDDGDLACGLRDTA